MTKEECNQAIEKIYEMYCRNNYPELRDLEGILSSTSDLIELIKNSTACMEQPIATYTWTSTGTSTGCEPPKMPIFGNEFTTLSRRPGSTDYVLIETLTKPYLRWRTCEGEVMLFCLAGKGHLVRKTKSGEVMVYPILPDDATFFMEDGDLFTVLSSDAVLCIVSDTNMENSGAVDYKPNELESLQVLTNG